MALDLGEVEVDTSPDRRIESNCNYVGSQVYSLVSAEYFEGVEERNMDVPVELLMFES